MISTEKNLFKSYLEVEERSTHTIRQYMSILNWFEEFLSLKGVSLQQLTEMDILTFQLWIKEKRLQALFKQKFKRKPTAEELKAFAKTSKEQLKGKSLYKYLTTIRKFLEVNDIQLNWNRIPTPKIEDNFNPEILSPEEIELIAQTAEQYCTFKHRVISSKDCSDCPKGRSLHSTRQSKSRRYPDDCFYFDGLKLKAMILLAYEAALRTEELCALRLKHLNLERREVFIERPLKHSQQQAVPLSEKLVTLLKTYLEKNKSVKNGEDILFPTKTGKKYHANNFATHVFRPIASAAGFNVRYYALRHSRATNLIKQGLDIGWVRRITRHRNINNVLKYIHLTSEDVREQLERKNIF
ncbi:MAG: tyrosine-type recombinase/integrase [Candidatus Heimdallarchaeota archaeon]|nr:tyrosine-type recombinase/integrase [Candidatus Heimdallarchaeota archaeon]